MLIHVICCNDSVEYAVINDEVLANQKLEELRREYFERNKWSFNNSESAYHNQCYWHIHTVAGE